MYRVIMKCTRFEFPVARCTERPNVMTDEENLILRRFNLVEFNFCTMNPIPEIVQVTELEALAIDQNFDEAFHKPSL